MIFTDIAKKLTYGDVKAAAVMAICGFAGSIVAGMAKQAVYNHEGVKNQTELADKYNEERHSYSWEEDEDEDDE